MKGVNKSKEVVAALETLSDFLGLEKSRLLAAKKDILDLYAGGIQGGAFLPDILDFEFSFKAKIGSSDIIPALRYTNYVFYDQKKYGENPKLAEIIQKKRLASVKKVFLRHGLLSQKNKKLLDLLFEENADKEYLAPVQFGAHLEKSGAILKTYFWCDEKYALPDKARRAKLSDLVRSNFYFKGNRDFLKNGKIFFFSVDFKGKDRSLKIYTLYKGYEQLFKDLCQYGFKEQTWTKLKDFVRENRKHLDDAPVVCFQIMNGKLSVKKVEIFIRKKYRNTAAADEIRGLFLDNFNIKIKKQINSQKIIKNIYVFSVGEEFVTVYSRFKLWN
jgi:hypothetical protein